MRIAITGGTGFVGRHLARSLVADGHEVVLISRGVDRRDEGIRELARARFCAVGLDDPSALAEAFAGCDGVAHCAGINRELGAQTYERVHLQGTQNVVEAARRAGARRLTLMSFFRARPACGSPYHESKWGAEEIVRASDLDYTILKAGVIYGTGDHMLDHLSHAFHTFPVFGFVGFKDQHIRPVAVAEIVRVLRAALIDGRLARETVGVNGPEELALSTAVRRVAAVVGKRPWMFPLPLWFHYLFAWTMERVMVTPLVGIAQVRILSEGIVEPGPLCGELPAELRPKTPFTEEQIRAGLPAPGRSRLSDVRCFAACAGRG